MNESLKARLDFPNAIVQSQGVRSLVAAVLKEKGPDERVSSWATWEALWEQCCSGCAPVRSGCCDALVLLVEQGHADLRHVLDGALNRLPSAGSVQGLTRVVGRLLQMQADERGDARPSYSIGRGGSPHPYVTALENRPDCWPGLLPEIDYVRLAAERDEPAHVDMLAPFLRYVYCQPGGQRDRHAPLRHGLLGVLLPQGCADDENSPPSRGSESLLRYLCHMVPYMPVDSAEAVLELHGYLRTLLPFVARARGESWRGERARLALQLLCACHVGLESSGGCGAPVGLLQRLLPSCMEDVPAGELLTGLSLLLLEASAPQQTGLLALALSLVPEEAERCPWAAPVLVLPLLQLQACSALTEPLADARTHGRNRTLAHSLLRSAQKPTHSNTRAGVGLPSPLSPWYSQVQVAVQVLRRVADDATAAGEWLLSVPSALRSSGQRPPKALGLIVAHLVVRGQAGVCKLALDAARAIALADPSQAPSLLPVLLLRLGKESDPAVSHAVLSSLPDLCTHRLCVPQTLRVLQTLANAPKLRAVTMRLVTALWVKYERVYPALQRVLLLGQRETWSAAVGKDVQWEHILARAACIRDICTERPHQHGADMLAAITHTLNQCSGPGLAAPAALVLRGLQQLCRAEVVDIVSSWRALGPRLSCDSRPLVVKAVAELLALVPQLTSRSEEYEKLREEATSLLWGYALSKECEVASCGYRALSAFPEVLHTVLHLPEPARPAARRPEDEDDEKRDNEEDLSVPGSSYVKLLTITPSPVLPALEVFLTSLVRQEMERMPRGVYHAALRGADLRSDQGKTVSGIPSFLLKTYERNKQPGLKPGLADGLLLTYELPVQTDRDGRPVPRLLLSRSRSYQQTLTALVHEVNIQPSEWHRALLLPRAWQGFMDRAFHAVLQGRRGELEMQQKRDGKEESPEEHQRAWLWARDHLTDVVKSAAKDNPAVQGNSILALSGLAAVVAKHERDLPLGKDGGLGVGPETLSTSGWLSTVLDTLLGVISGGYDKTRGQVFPWLQHRSYSGENAASPVARSCAALALSLVAPALVSRNRDGVAEVLTTLLASLPGRAAADHSQAVQFHLGLVLGMVTSGLHRERLGEAPAQKDADILASCLDSLESCSFDGSLGHNAGCVLGLALVLGALCDSGQAQHGGRVTLVLDKLLASLRGSGGQGVMPREVLAYSVACLSVSAFRGGLVDADKAQDVVDALYGVTEDSQHTVGFSLALGLVVHGLAACGHGKAEDFHPRLQAAWIQILLAEGCGTMQRLAALNGLVALVGSESYVTQPDAEAEQSPRQQGRLNEVIRSVTQVVTLSGATGLQSNSARLMGHLHLAHGTCGRSHAAVPQDFGYLPEKSVIRAIMDYVTDAGKKGPECSPPGAVNATLASLASVGAAFQYPPVNWSAALSPLARLDFGRVAWHRCVALAASQARTSPSASLFLGSWLSPPLVHGLGDETRAHLYETLAAWMGHVAEDKLRVFLETLGVQHFQEELWEAVADGGQRPRALCATALLGGLERALALPDPPGHCRAILRSTAEKIFALLPDDVPDGHTAELYEGLAGCLSALPDEDVGRITQLTETTTTEKGCLLLTRLVSRGRVPLRRLHDVIAAVLRGWPSRRAGRLLLHAFCRRCMAAGPDAGVSEHMEWLLELMGYARNVAYGATAVSCDTTRATDFLLQVFAGAVAAWGDPHTPLLLGTTGDHWPSRKPESKPHASLPQLAYGEEALADTSLSLADTSLSLCLLGLPHSLPRLLSTEPWSGQSNKAGHACESRFIDWLSSMAESPEGCLSATSIASIRAALLALKSSAEFQKKAVWTRAYGW